jgi:hypothetical protein
MTPTVPPTVQDLDWKEEFPVDDAGTKMANRLTSLIAHWDDAVAADSFAPGVQQRSVRRAFARARIDYGVCTAPAGSGVFERDRDAWSHAPGRPRFPLQCEEGPLDLSFKLDDKTGRVTEFSLNPPRRTDATCWE